MGLGYYNFFLVSLHILSFLSYFVLLVSDVWSCQLLRCPHGSNTVSSVPRYYFTLHMKDACACLAEG